MNQNKKNLIKEYGATKMIGIYQQLTSFCFLIMLVFGCADTTKYPVVNLETLSINVDQDANINSPVPFDLIIAYTPGAFDETAKLTARDYFKKRDQILNDNPNMIQIWHWELVPGQRVCDLPIKRGSSRPTGALIFADYQTAGDHRIRVGTQKNLTIKLMNQGMQIAP